MKHSSIIGGSTADRLLHCPGSFSLIQRLPQQDELPSEYAEFGTHCHAVMDRLVQAFANGFPANEDKMIQLARSLEGQHFHDRVLTNATLDDAIFPAVDTLYDLMDLYSGGFRAAGNDLRVRFPGVPGAFGTADLLLVSPTHAIMVDWKFGQGVPVKAVYPDPVAGDLVNSQVMFYLAGAIHTVPRLFTKRTLVGAIIQPRTEERLTHTEVSRQEIRGFIEDVEGAVIAALEPNPPFGEGAHCRWCPAHPICPLKTAALFEISAQGVVPARPVPADTDNGEYGEFLAKAKVMADYAASYKSAIDDALHTYLSNGGTVPGWKLKYKTKLRQWIDETIVYTTLTELGFLNNEIFQTKLQTFGVAEKAAKRLGVKIPDYLRVAPESTETVVVPDTDPAPAVDFDTATSEFSELLTQLQNSVSPVVPA